MCPQLLIAAAVIGAGASIYGAVQSSNAAKKQSDAIGAQNAANTEAQNQGFTARLAASGAQTEMQKQAFTEQMGNEQQIADAMRQRQNSAFQRQQDILDVSNTQEGALHDVGMRAGSDLLDATSGTNLAQAQTDWQTQAANLLDGSNIHALNNPTATGGTGDDTYTNAALVRRAAEAATNIRGYGAKAAKIASYRAPLDLAQNAVTNTATGIMPAQVASKLFQTSFPTLVQPAETSWSNAVQQGEAGISAAQQAGQTQQNIAGLQYQNSTDLANLQQANKVQTAANIAEQAKADAAFQAAMGGVISGFGNLGLQVAGQYGPLPGFLDKTAVPPAFGGNAPISI